MKEYRTKMTENGRIVIPADCRKQLGLEPGAELIIHIKDSELILTSQHQALLKARALVKKYIKNKSLVNELWQLRKEDKRHEKDDS